MSGCYASESLRGSMSCLGRLLAGKLQEIHALGRFPQRPDSALVVRQPDAARRPGGAIVIGLGTLGELARAFAGGLLEYACVCLQVRAAGHVAAPPMGEHGLRVASLLSGSGYGGLSIALRAIEHYRVAHSAATERWACARWRTGQNWKYARARPCAASMRATRRRDGNCCTTAGSISTCWWRWRPRRNAWPCWDATGPCRHAWPAPGESSARRRCAP
ncbi:hypothetical protein ACQ4WP_14240 [Janthinobacterium sp. GB4P2]|uniref:hypothetical protein n=1 Tax=Janthinobacterium sp. GB4P2 TaxID=3424189 RepID=UPI003F29D45F